MKLKPYIGQAAIASRVKELAGRIEEFIGSEEAVLAANLKGSFMFFSDIVREIGGRNVSVDFLSTEGYSGACSTGNVKITRDFSLDVNGKKVVLIEDIVDTGLTLSHLIHYIKEVHKPSELKVCVLLDKPSRRKTEVHVDFTGFEISDEFVVGYGLDYNEKLRNLPYIALLELDEKI